MVWGTVAKPTAGATQADRWPGLGSSGSTPSNVPEQFTANERE